MARIFVYDGREYPDPDPTSTPEEVRTTLSALLPELANAEIKASKRPAQSGEGEDDIFEMKRRVGTKGEGEGEEDTEAEEDTETEEEAEPKDENPAPVAKRGDEIKVVVVLKAGKALIGVISPDCDPIYETVLEADMEKALASVPPLIEVANLRWDAHPRNPEANLPKPELAPVTSRPARVPEKPKTPAQTNFF